MYAHNGKWSVRAFLATHPVFTYEEFARGHGGAPNPHTLHNLLAYHIATGHILRIRRGLYATVPYGMDPARFIIDPYPISSRLTEDAVIAYHAALQYHGRAYTVMHRYTYLTRHRARPFRFQGSDYVPVAVPAALRAFPDGGGGVLEIPPGGGGVRVTSLERTLVDVMDAPDLGGGWEEIWRSLASIEFVDVDAVLDYAIKLGSALTTARVGFFLEQHRDAWLLSDSDLERFRARAPAQPRYFDRPGRTGRLVHLWNLIVPEPLLSRSWEEVL